MAAKPITVGIIGGGLAGLSAGCELAESGYAVTLFERKPFVGGRASSYEHPATGEVVDNCQHVLLGCCTNLIDFYRKLGVGKRIRWFDTLTFIEPGGRQSKIGPSGLPAPLHTSLSFLAADSLSFGDKLAISRAMMSMMSKLPDDTEENFLEWLKRHGQTERAIERFWKVVLVSALNEDLDQISVRYAVQVFRESFLKSAEAGKMGVPTVPLTELYDVATGFIRSKGGKVNLRASVEAIRPTDDGVEVQSAAGTEKFDYVIVAVPHHGVAKLLPQSDEAKPIADKAAQLGQSPITGIHLWFDRQITDLEHAVLLERTIQWMFHKSLLLERHKQNGDATSPGSYVELVVSASKSLVDLSKSEVVELAVKELAEFFPAVAEAKLLKSAVIKEYFATYSIKPLSDRFRPDTTTAWPRVFLAGDWINTGWPATMEGAVRSGKIAAEALAGASGSPRTFLKADLEASGLMTLFK